METSEVRRRVVDTIERAKRTVTERRARTDEAAQEYSEFLERIATPLFRQTANVLRAHGYPFTVFTPGGAVRLTSDRTAEDFVELSLDTSGDRPVVIGHCSRTRGRRIVEDERPIGEGPIRELGEEQVLEFILAGLSPLVER